MSATTGNDTLSGTAGNDVIDLLAGEDSYLGLDGADSILGNDGNDTIYGGNGADTILGGAGNDRIYAELGSDSVDAGSGTQDRIFYNQDGGAAITATITSSGGSSGVNRAIVTTAAQGNDTIQGFEILFASNGADFIQVNSSATAIDLLHVLGGGGNDTLVHAYEQNGVFANYSSPNVTGGVFVDLSTGVATDGLGGTDRLLGFTAVNATAFGDTLVGSNGNDRFRGLEGNDCIMGGNGAQDMIDYNYLSASSQAISVNLASGRANDGMGFTDTLISIEQVRGGSGNDVLIGDSINNTFRGNSGSDTIDGAGGTADAADYAFAGAAISVNLATGQAQDGQGGVDSLSGIEYVYGSAHADTLIGSNGNDNLRGNAGNDSIDGGNGSDIADYSNNASNQAVSVDLSAGRANDGLGGRDTLSNIEYVYGGWGNDTIIGGNGAESLWGNSGNDCLIGGDGADTLYGGSGNDTIAGGNGNDIIYGEAGSDSIDAGVGTFDSIRYNQTDGQAITATINAVGGSSGYNAATVTTASQGNDTIINFENINGSINNDSFIVDSAATANTLLYLFGSTGNDTITMNVASSAVLADYNAASGNTGFTRGVSVDLVAGYATDYAGTDQLINVRGINGSSLNDTILGSANDDRFREQGGSDSIDGRGGSDMLDYSGNGSSQSVSVNLETGVANDGRGGTDSFVSMEFVRGGSGNDTIIGNTADNELRGNAGSDSMDGGASGFDIADYANNSSSQAISVNLTAGRANDGLGGTDTLSSIEYIRGGSGNDTMVGSDANERFRGNGGNDSIDGGNGTADILDLSPTSAAVSASLVTGTANDGLGGTDSFTGIEVIYAGTGADTLIGGAGNDIFDGGMNGDLIDGGLGADRVRYYLVNGNNSSVTRGVSVDLAAQRATDGWGGADTLIGIERVTATSFADTLLGDNVSNRFNGLAGNDSFDGGLSTDWLEYTDSAATSGVTVNLTTGTASDGRGGTDSFTSVENVIGGTFGDHLTGTAQLGRSTSRLRGAAGSDTLVGIDGEFGEFVVADYADQTVGLSVNLASGSVNDGLGGVDQLVNIRGAIMYGNHADTLIGTNGDDWLSPSGGNDTIIGGNGFDILSYDGNPTDGVSVNLATGIANDGDGGTDAFSGIEGVWVSYSNDTVIGDNGDNFISLGTGADFADAAGGRDVISYALGFSPNTSVYVFNEAGNQLPFTVVTIDLEAGRATDYGNSVDTIINFEDADGSSMHDSILGSSGDNEFDGYEGNDTINGGGGNDTIWSDAGDDLFMGGAGNDLYLMAYASGDVTISDASGNDTVSLDDATGQEIAADDIASATGIDAIDLAGGGNTLHLTAARVVGSSGTGLLRAFGGSGDRVIFDDAGWALTGSSGGFDTMANVAGNATVIASTGLASSDIGSVVNGGDGNDTLGGGNGADTIDGGNGSDIIAGFGGSDSILGGDGNDSLSGGAGNDTVSGGIGNDLIQGDAGNDILSGGDGDDTLNGGAPASGLDDTLAGGTGNDLYIAPEAVVFDAGGSDTVSMLGGGVDTLSATAGDLDGNPGIEAVDLAGSGRLLGLTAEAVIRLSDTDVLRVYGSGSDRVVFEDTGWTRSAPSGGLVTFTNGGATVIAAESLVPVTSGPTTGDDALSGTTGNDVIDLLAGNDSYLGLDGADSILGNDGSDTIYGGNGADSIAGGNGDDRIYGEAGSDTIDAGAGTADRILYNQTGGEAITATINSSGGNTGINTATVSTATQGTDSIQGFEVLIGSGNGDRITVTTAATQNFNLFLFGGAGNDTIIDNYRVNGVFADYNTPSANLTSGISVDLTSGIATDGFGGTDSLVGITAVNGTSFADTMLGSASNDRFRGLQGNDLMDGRGGTGDMVDYSANTSSQAVSVNLHDSVASDGMGGTDTLIGIEQVRGGAGNDLIIGDANNNNFRGNNGNDTMDGGAGTFDVVDYAFASGAVSVNLNDSVASDGANGTDRLVNIEVV